jgi:hypothetical protein
MKRAALLAACGALAASCSVLVDPDGSRLDRFATVLDTGTRADLAVTDAPAALDAGDDAATPDASPPDATTLDAPDAPADDAVDAAIADAAADVIAADAPDAPPGDGVSSRCPGSCDDGVECTADSCDETAGACVHRPDTSVCGTREVCEATMGCTRVDCTADRDCQDETRCNGLERCDGNRCVPGTAVRCDDGVECTIDRCDPASGACASVADGARCDDGAFCNGAETCDAARGCLAGTAPTCDDRVGCTTDRCDESMRRCVSTPNPSACAAPGPCVTSTCDPAIGCRNVPIPGYCDSFCASGATCNAVNGQCAGGGTPRNCSDSNPCTTDLCDPVARMCRSTAIDADGDGAPAARVGGAMCAGGDDCNDADPAVNRRAMEVCNGVDDDCDGMTDEGGVCIAPGEDCAHAIAVDLTGSATTATRTSSTMGRTSDFTSSCTGPGPDLVYAVTIPGSDDLVAEAAPMGGNGDPVVSVRDACAGAELGCNGDATQRARDARVFLRGRSGGATRVVFVVVDDAGAQGGPFTLRLTRRAAIAPGNCGNRTLFDVTVGGTVIGRTTTGLGSHSGSCGGGFLGEDVLVFNAASRMAVNLLLVTGNQVAYVRQRQCGGFQSDQVACFAGSQRVTVDSGAAWIIVDAARDSGEGQYILRVQP